MQKFKLVYADTVGANCKKEKYDGNNNFTEPDGDYYYTAEGLTDNGDGTYDSESYHNVLRHKTDDPRIPEEVRKKINDSPGDFLDHGNQRKSDVNGPYNNNESPGGSGCTIGKNGQQQQDEFMKILMDGVEKPEDITKKIRSFQHIRK